MSHAGNLRLQWHDHGSELIDLTRDLCGQTELTDVTLTCKGGVTFSAHRLVLAGASNHFRAMFQGMPAWKHPVIFLKDVDPVDMEYFLQFIYYGEVSVPSKELDNMIMVAKELGIKGLDSIPENEDDFRPKSLYTSKVKSSNSCSKSRFSGDINLKRKAATIKSSQTHSSILSKKIKQEQKTDETEDPLIEERDVAGEGHDIDSFRGDDDNEHGSLLMEDTLEPIEQNDEEDEDDDGDESYDPKEGSSAKKAVAQSRAETPEISGYTGELEGDNILEVLESTKGYPKVALNGFSYVIHRKQKHWNSWRCSKSRCKGKLVTDVESLQGQLKHGHDHPPDQDLIDKCKFMTKMKSFALSHRDRSPSDLLNELLSETSPQLRDMMKRETLLRKIRDNSDIPITGYTGEKHGDNVLMHLESSKSHPFVSMNGFMYGVMHRHKSHISWRCQQSKKGCRGKLVTDREMLQGELKQGHTHPPDYAWVERCKFQSKLKNIVLSNPDIGPTQLAKQLLEDIEETKRLGDYRINRDSLTRRIRLIRSESNPSTKKKERPPYMPERID